MCRTNGPLGELFLITQKFVFLEVLLAMFCFVPNSHIFQVGIGKEDSKRLSVVSGGSRSLQTIWGISGCCLTPGGGAPPGRKISTCQVSSLSGEHGVREGKRWGSKWGVVVWRSSQSPLPVLLSPLADNHLEKSRLFGVLRVDANFSSICVGIPGRMIENWMAVAALFLTYSEWSLLGVQPFRYVVWATFTSTRSDFKKFLRVGLLFFL